MANPWFRLWSDMVNDPKWRTIAKKSNQRIGDVMAVYLHMMTCASNATERGRTQGWCDEDVASALDIDVQDVSEIREAMQGRVLDGDYLTGWEKRQPKREDNSSERGKNWRNSQNKTQSEDEQTQTNATERKNVVDTDTDTDTDKNKTLVETSFLEFWSAYPKKVSRQDALKAWKKLKPDAELQAKIMASLQIAKQSKDWVKDDGQFIPHAATWVNAKRWEDAIGVTVEQKPLYKVGDRKGDMVYLGGYAGWQKRPLERI